MMEIGTDIEKVERFKDLKRDDRFVVNNFTDQEIDYCFAHTRPEIHLAGMFAAKEAAKKTIGDVLSMKDIEITHSDSGKPESKGLKLSISHTDETAVAVVLRE